MFFLLFAAGCLASARGQFGGYDPPPPICPAFSCPAGQKAVGNPEHQIWSYGCKDSGMNVFNMASFNANDPLAGMKGGKNLNKCCVERDICKQTCGMTSKACHEGFSKCSKKICKGDQNCQLQAMMSDILSEPIDSEEDKAKDDKFDPEAAKCKGYKRGQKDACKCVAKGDFRTATEAHLKVFYGKHNPEKLSKDGEIKDVDDVWKKWKGKEPEMFLALATKYKDKAVQMREKPKPPPYKPPEEGEGGSFGEPEAEAAEEPTAAEEPPPKKKSDLDADDRRFEEKLKELEKEKRRAAEEEDYEAAEGLKEKVKELKQKEQQRLTKQKAKAVADEDFAEAKRLKNRMGKLEL